MGIRADANELRRIADRLQTKNWMDPKTAPVDEDLLVWCMHFIDLREEVMMIAYKTSNGHWMPSDGNCTTLKVLFYQELPDPPEGAS